MANLNDSDFHRKAVRRRSSGFAVRISIVAGQRCVTLGFACALVTAGIAPAQGPAASEIVLHNFAASLPRGANPSAGVVRDSAGNLYGTTLNGGAWNAGVVYKLDTAGRQRVLYSFRGGADGANPKAGVVGDSVGNL